MVGLTALTVLCTGAVAFYARFLFALFRECRRNWIGCLVRLSPETEEYTVTKADETAESRPHAA